MSDKDSLIFKIPDVLKTIISKVDSEMKVNVLLYLYENGRTNLEEIANKLDIVQMDDQSFKENVLKVLVKSGLVHTEYGESEDYEAISFYSLSNLGEEYVEKIKIIADNNWRTRM